MHVDTRTLELQFTSETESLYKMAYLHTNMLERAPLQSKLKPPGTMNTVHVDHAYQGIIVNTRSNMH